MLLLLKEWQRIKTGYNTKIKILVIVIFGIIINGTLQAQIPNNGFISWTRAGGYSIPAELDNLNPVTSTAGKHTSTICPPGS